MTGLFKPILYPSCGAVGRGLLFRPGIDVGLYGDFHLVPAVRRNTAASLTFFTFQYTRPGGGGIRLQKEVPLGVLLLRPLTFQVILPERSLSHSHHSTSEHHAGLGLLQAPLAYHVFTKSMRSRLICSLSINAARPFPKSFMQPTGRGRLLPRRRETVVCLAELRLTSFPIFLLFQPKHAFCLAKTRAADRCGTCPQKIGP